MSDPIPTDLEALLEEVVRPLKWMGRNPGDSGHVWAEAECIIGLYRLSQSKINGSWRWSLNALDGPWSLPFSDSKSARDAAAADYRSRIAAALNLEAIIGIREARKDVGPSEIASEIWEFLFNETKDCVPDELTDDLLSKVATSLLAGYSIVRRDP